MPEESGTFLITKTKQLFMEDIFGTYFHIDAPESCIVVRI
jgi:hypothetical protein